MNNSRYLAILALLLPSMAEAASVIKPIVACREEADSKKVLEFLGKNDKAGLDKFSAPKLNKGDCLTLSKGMAVTIDTKDTKLFCVRPTGGLDCYWTVDADINQNATETQAHRAIIPAAAVINAGVAEAWVAWEIIVWAVAALPNNPRA